MIELNLLPKELRRKRKRRKAAELPKIPMLPIAVGVIAVLLLTHVALMILARGNRKLAEELATKWDEMQPQREKTDGIAKEINALQKRIDAIRKIAKPDLDWARLLGGLNQAVISNVWLSEFSIATARQERGKKQVKEIPLSLDLNGYALGKSETAMSTVGRFMESLKRNKNFFGYFEEIELQNIRNAMISGEEVMMFKLICKFKGTKPPAAEKPKKKGRRRRK
ncbi:PilN domain-containing protein [Candidatus Omnitrophota bacterium]